MDVRQLRALTAVGDHRSFSAAAKALGTVQSNVSTHVSRLERELGLVLVDRATNELTAEGLAVVARARRIDAELQALESDVASLKDVVTGSVRIGVIGTVARWLVPPLVEEVHEAAPEVHLTILDATTSSLILQLVNGQVDLAVVNTPVEDPEVRVTALFDEDCMVVAPLGHPLSGRAEVSPDDVAAHDLLLPARGTAFRAELDADAAAAGIELRAKAEIDGMRLLASLAFSGFGAAILPASAAPEWLGGDWQRIVLHGFRQRSVGLARRRRGLPSAAERAVTTTVGEVIERVAPSQPGIRVRGR